MTEAGAAHDELARDRPSVARLYDFFLGGHHNFAADRELARKLLAIEPDARRIVGVNRAFLGRAVRFLADSGVRQFLDLGSGIPTQENVHEIAQRRTPDARVVYVDNDPVAVAHSKQILTGNGLATVINADIRDPAAVLGHPKVRDLFDLSEPVGLLMITVLNFVPDSDDPAGVVAAYGAGMADGSYLAVSHATHEAIPAAAARVRDLYTTTTAPACTRTHAEIVRLFDGFGLVEPGLVWMATWRPDDPLPEHPERDWFYAGVGRKAAGS